MADEQEAGAGVQTSGQEAAQERGSEPKGATLMTGSDEQAAKEETGGDADKSKDAGPDKGAEKKDDPADKTPDKPEGYDLKFAEGTQVDQELLAGFQKTAHELGISQGKAQKLVELYQAHAARAGDRLADAQRQALEKARTEWEAEIQKSPGFVQERENIRSALRQYGDAELYDLLDQTNLGSHPKMWAFMSRVGKALAEPGFHGKNAGRNEKTAAEILYPNQGK